MRMKFRLDEGENSVKKRNAGRIQIKLEAGLRKRQKLHMGMAMVVITVVMMMIVKPSVCTITYVLHKTEEQCRQFKLLV